MAIRKKTSVLSTKDAVFASAASLFSSHGFNGVSTEDIAIAASAQTPQKKLDAFIAAFVRMTETRPWMPAIMLREIAEGAPRLDPETMSHMRKVIEHFGAILLHGHQRGVFRAIHPVLAYESIIGPIII